MKSGSLVSGVAALIVASICFSLELQAEEVAASVASAHVISLADSSSDVGMLTGMVKMIGGLLLCIGLFAGGMFFVKKYGPQTNRYSKRRRLELREKLHISSKMAATLIAVDNREFLIATSGDSVTIVPTYSLNTGSFEDSLDEACRTSEARNG